ncbi:MAG: hypothetical protein NTY35_03650 [Planctomycetota bacterium]|nr:hypothetical protein [Planctomycetota bacterium]
MKSIDPWTIDVRGSWLARAALRGLELLRGPLSALGVDVGVARTLLAVRFLLDKRGTFAGLEGQFQTGFVLLLAMGWLSGIGVGIAAVAKLPGSTWVGLIAVHAFVMSLFVMLVHFGTILVDGSDVAPIAARPVSDRTFFAVRLAHLSVYVAAIASTSMFWPLLLGWLAYPWWAILVLVPIAALLGSACAIGVVAAGFSSLLALLGPDRFQRAAFWAQALAAGLFVGGPQLITPILIATLPKDGGAASMLWIEWVPPYCAGALYDLVTLQASATTVERALVAIGAPLVLSVIALLAAARGYVRGISADVVGPLPRTRTWPRISIGRRICRNSDEHAGYGLAAALVFRDKTFLRAVVPLAFALFAGALGGTMPLLREKLALPPVIGALPLYIFAIVVPAVAELLSVTSTPESAAALDALPIQHRVDVLRGALKAMLLRVVAPLFVAGSAFLLVLSHGRIGIHVPIAACGAFAIGLLSVRLLALRMPFSHRPLPGEGSMRNLPVMFGVVGVAILAGGVHFAASLHTLTTIGALILAVLLVPLAWHGLRGIREPRRA